MFNRASFVKQTSSRRGGAWLRRLQGFYRRNRVAVNFLIVLSLVGFLALLFIQRRLEDKKEELLGWEAKSGQAAKEKRQRVQALAAEELRGQDLDERLDKARARPAGAPVKPGKTELFRAPLPAGEDITAVDGWLARNFPGYVSETTGLEGGTAMEILYRRMDEECLAGAVQGRAGDRGGLRATAEMPGGVHPVRRPATGAPLRIALPFRRSPRRAIGHGRVSAAREALPGSLRSTAGHPSAIPPGWNGWRPVVR